MSQHLLVEVEKGVAYLTLNRPQQGNAIDLALAQALLHAAIQCDQDRSIRCVVLTRAGRTPSGRWYWHWLREISCSLSGRALPSR